MAASTSKRQQARNERTLQDLVKGIPGNNVCADCSARNPGWASWSLGIFLCMRCAALHRKLGTHISKVKSLSMDSWSAEQVETMRRMGNTASNRAYNPTNIKPPVPFDADEADSAMERFIRQKYTTVETLTEQRRPPPSRHDSRSPEPQEYPERLPTKKASRFGLRSASSIFPMSSKSKREAAARAHLENNRRSPSPPPRRNKESRVFGQTVNLDMPNDEEGTETKLAKLKDMGFGDERRNAQILRGVNGNLEKAIETLVRLGERSNPSSRSRTPISPTAGFPNSNLSGLSVQRSRDTASSPKSPNNPWENITSSTPAPPQSSQSTGSLAPAGNNPFNRPNGNPYGLQPSQSQYALNQQFNSLDQSFQGLSVDPTQPLFPNHTGGVPNGQRVQQTAPPPMPSIPQGQYQGLTNDAPSQPYNPWMQQSQSQQQPMGQVNGSFSSNPYAELAPLQTQQQNQFDYLQKQQFTPNQYNSPIQQQQTNPFGVPQQQQQPQMQMNPYAAMQTPMQTPVSPSQNNPYAQQNQGFSQPSQQPQYYQNQQHNPYQQPQQLMAQPTGRADKSAILALYNNPQPMPTPPAQMQTPVNMSQSPQGQYQNQGQQQAQSYFQTQGQNQTQQQQGQMQQGQNQAQSPIPSSQSQGYMGGLLPLQQQSQTTPAPFAAYTTSSPLTASRNPFMITTGGATNYAQAGAPNGMGGSQVQGARHVSQESATVDIGGWHGQNGRHSPDAFASLSARSMG